MRTARATAEPKRCETCSAEGKVLRRRRGSGPLECPGCYSYRARHGVARPRELWPQRASKAAAERATQVAPARPKGSRLPHDLLTVPQAAARLGLHPESLYRQIREGQFPPAVHLGRMIRVSVPRLEAYLHGALDKVYNVEQVKADVKRAAAGVAVQISGVPLDNAAAIGAAASSAMRAGRPSLLRSIIAALIRESPGVTFHDDGSVSVGRALFHGDAAKVVREIAAEG